MISLLARIFIKNNEDTTSSEVRQAYGVLCGGVGIFLNLLLFAGKFFSGLISNSISITADAVNNLSDAGSSIIMLIGFKIAGQKPDPEHPYGHGRMEYLSGLAVSAVILLMAFELFQSSVKKLFSPSQPSFSPLVIGILVISILIKLYMYLYNRSISKKISSEAMKATAADSLSDTVSTFVVLATTLISYFTNLQLDAFCGILVALFIFYTGFQAAKDTLNPLLGTSPDPDFVKQIEETVLSNESVLGIHDLLVHNYGPGRTLISLHAEVPADGDILVLHDTIDNIERILKEKLNCEAVIHMDPVCINDPEVSALKDLFCSYLFQLDPALSLHDFRIVKGPTHTNIIFDILVPFRFRLADTEIVSLMEEKAHTLDPNYFLVINIDKKYA